MRKLFLTGAAALALAAAALSTATPTSDHAALIAEWLAGRTHSILVADAEGAGVDARAGARMLALRVHQPADAGIG
ncbi:MAG: hypothetical protein JSR21_13490 [Proteobacteria bacterium]|nr:hypothetical protein [Pseudomonadota bacterium]MBS0561058.1 hypothetical protein [Pseudomonadota bacterium]